MDVTEGASPGARRLPLAPGLRFVVSWSLALSILAGALIPASLFVPGVAIAVWLGAALGGTFGLAQGITSRLPALVGRVAWLLFGVALGVFCAHELGAFTKIGGEHGRLAWATLAVSLLAGAFAGVILASHQDGRDRPATWSKLPPRWQWAVAALLILAGLALATYEGTAAWLYAYPAA